VIDKIWFPGLSPNLVALGLAHRSNGLRHTFKNLAR